jgi:nanoRNase/pAp phosphatase (c-di-AMP/oligoRNAs hydrolase)
MAESQRYRLVTRSDFDGVVSAALLKDRDMIDEILFVHPKDVQDGKIDIADRDIMTNLPYSPGCYMAFDHHSSETVRVGEDAPANLVLQPNARSATRVVYDFYGGKEAFPGVSEDMVIAVDQGDSGDFEKEEVLHPEGWVLLNFLTDARTGLGRYHDFNISNYQLMMALIDYCREQDIDELLKQPDVAERVKMYREHEEPFREQLKRCASVHGHVVVLDLREEETIYVGNRFVVYALFPESKISIHVIWGKQKQNTVFAIGKSIFDRTAKANIGELALSYGGGGHTAAGTCQVANDKADGVLKELIEQISFYG